MRRIIITVIICYVIAVFSPFSIQAADELLQCNPSGTTFMNIGDIIECDINPVSDSDRFQFFGAIDEKILLTITDRIGYSRAACLELYDPSEQLVDNWCATKTAGVGKQIPLTETGTYTVLVREGGDNQTETYRIALQRIFPAPPEATALLYDDTIVNQTIDPVPDSDVFLYYGTADDTVLLTITDRIGYSRAACLELYDPSEQLVDNWCATKTAGVGKQIPLTETGTYTVLVREGGDNQTETYNLSLQCVFGVCIDDPHTGIFSDVPKNYWAYKEIMAIYDAGITTGCSKKPLKYCPDRAVNRSQMAVFLERGINDGDYTPPPATGIFDDVPVNFWAADWIEQLYKDGVTTGCAKSPLRYCPDRAVNRAQMAVFLLRSKYDSNYTPPKATGIFKDVPVTYWAADWIEQLHKEGITTGCSTNPLKYCPLKAVNRAQMAVFLSRTFGL